ncbi:MAG TPA: putative porin, partial [Chitinophagaceae bacterium]|nr:putative porin [Chitinophagaceae bacterium]
ARLLMLDSSIIDFRTRYPIPASHIYLGNLGNATRSIFFDPSMKAGWDPGFHAFDIYKWKIESAQFYTTTRPYSEINYFLGSRVEQIIEILHTQNIKPNWNASFRYRLINSPGFFKNQKTAHYNYLFTSWFQSVSKRYTNYLVLLGNRMQSAENGAIRSDQDYLNDPVYKDRFNIPTNLGGDPEFGRDPFSTQITTGNKYRDFQIVLRQQYDLGKKDSIVTDSTVIPLFYPNLRFEHTFQLHTYNFRYLDYPNFGNTNVYVPDSAYYHDNYGITLVNQDTVQFFEKWREILNDFSIYQFPDKMNQLQFIRLGLTLQNLRGEFTSSKRSFYNLIGHGEYRNKTRNQQWDLGVNGKIWFTGLNAGDFEVAATLQKFSGKKRGYIQLGFENSNATPAFELESRSSFYLLPVPLDLKKENKTHILAAYSLPSLQLRLAGHLYLINNYTYLRHFYQVQQYDTLFNVIRASLEKTFNLGKHFKWHTEICVQKVIGRAPVELPVLYTRNRIGYEGGFGFKNLNIAIGLELRYHTPYKADGYSPVLGMFFFQDKTTIQYNKPDISFYLHFRIRAIKAFVRAENLNTIRNLGGINFTDNNPVAPGYVLPGLQLRLGIYWSFVN